jgi:hypothetical protein
MQFIRKVLPANPARVDQPLANREYFKLTFSSGSSIEPQEAAHLDSTSSQPIEGTGDSAMSAIETSLAALSVASALATKLPFISPVAGLLLQALTMRGVSV